MLLVALAAAALAPRAAEAHGFMTAPLARNVVRPGACGVGCPHCCNFGGPGVCSNGGKLTWPASMAPICGTPDLASPGPVRATYAPGAVIELSLFISAQHGGRHVFRLCDGADASKDCFAQHTLQREDGTGPYSWTPLQGGPSQGGEYGQSTQAGVSGEQYTWRYRLPPGVTCDHCVLQWWWTTANSCRVPGAPARVGSDPGMSMCNTPGPFPEEFFNCADVSIRPGGADASDAPWRPWPQFPLGAALQGALDAGNTGSTAEPTTQELQQLIQQGQQQQQGQGQPQQGQQQQPQPQQGQQLPGPRPLVQAGSAVPAGRVAAILGPPDGLPPDVLAALEALRGQVDQPWPTYLCRQNGAGARYWAVQRNCGLFIQCGPTEGWMLACPAGLVWDDSQKSCNYPALTNCGQRPLPAGL